MVRIPLICGFSRTQHNLLHILPTIVSCLSSKSRTCASATCASSVHMSSPSTPVQSEQRRNNGHSTCVSWLPLPPRSWFDFGFQFVVVFWWSKRLRVLLESYHGTTYRTRQSWRTIETQFQLKVQIPLVHHFIRIPVFRRLRGI